MMDKNVKIRIAILEDLAEVAEMLKELIGDQEDMMCIDVYFMAEEAMSRMPSNPPDILIVDIGLPRASGIEAIQYLRSRCPDTLFCIFTVYEDDEKIFRSLQAGARGYILKTAPSEKLMDALRELYRGGSPMSPSIARRILDSFQEEPQDLTGFSLNLSFRERELLDLLARGHSYKDIALIMSITSGSVKQYIHRIYEKLEVNNRTAAVNKFNKLP